MKRPRSEDSALGGDSRFLGRHSQTFPWHGGSLVGSSFLESPNVKYLVMESEAKRSLITLEQQNRDRDYARLSHLIDLCESASRLSPSLINDQSMDQMRSDMVAVAASGNILPPSVWMKYVEAKAHTLLAMDAVANYVDLVRPWTLATDVELSVDTPSLVGVCKLCVTAEHQEAASQMLGQLFFCDPFYKKVKTDSSALIFVRALVDSYNAVAGDNKTLATVETYVTEVFDDILLAARALLALHDPTPKETNWNDVQTLFGKTALSKLPNDNLKDFSSIVSKASFWLPKISDFWSTGMNDQAVAVEYGPLHLKIAVPTPSREDLNSALELIPVFAGKLRPGGCDVLNKELARFCCRSADELCSSVAPEDPQDLKDLDEQVQFLLRVGALPLKANLFTPEQKKSYTALQCLKAELTVSTSKTAIKQLATTFSGSVTGFPDVKAALQGVGSAALDPATLSGVCDMRNFIIRAVAEMLRSESALQSHVSLTLEILLLIHELPGFKEHHQHENIEYFVMRDVLTMGFEVYFATLDCISRFESRSETENAQAFKKHHQASMAFSALPFVEGKTSIPNGFQLKAVSDLLLAAASQKDPEMRTLKVTEFFALGR